MNVIEKVKKLGFPLNKYVVVGGAVMAAHGIRNTEDLDILVSPELFEKCRQEGWEVKEWTRPGKKGNDWLVRGGIELYTEILMEEKNIPTEELVRDAEVIDGMPFLPLARLIDFKKEYLRLYGRPKDAEDLALIGAYLASK